MPEMAMLRKVKFWSAIIPQTQGTASVSALTSVSINIQPPSEETWWVEFAFTIGTDYTGSHVSYYDYDGASARLHTRDQADDRADKWPHLEVQRILTNNLYARLAGYNKSWGATTFYYGYSGFKLSEPKWTPLRLNTNTRPWKRKTQFEIPDILTPVPEMIRDVFDDDIGDYRQAIILEEDVPLAVNEKGFPVERKTVYVYVDDFLSILGMIKKDPVKTGWKDYLTMLREKGVRI